MRPIGATRPDPARRLGGTAQDNTQGFRQRLWRSRVIKGAPRGDGTGQYRVEAADEETQEDKGKSENAKPEVREK